MTIYDVLERIIEARPFQEYEKETALKLIRQMRDLNVLGTMARFLDPATHECRQGEWWPDSVRCLICSVPMPPPVHDCQPVRSYSWQQAGRSSWTSRCRICGKEMI